MILQVGVKLLINDGSEKYLFLRRSPSFKPGIQKWDIPGGRINSDEPLDDALKREVREETGLEVESVELIAAQDIFVPAKDLHVVRLTYKGTTKSGEVKLSEEHSEYKWMTKEKVLTEPLDSYLEAIKDKF